MINGKNPDLIIIDELHYPKCVGTHIWEISEGVFDFTDETEDFSGTQYPTIEAAKAALDDYCFWLNKE